MNFTESEPRDVYRRVKVGKRYTYEKTGEKQQRVQCVDPVTGMTFRCDDTPEARASLVAKIEKVRKASVKDRKPRRVNYTRRPPYQWRIVEQFVDDGEIENAREYAALYDMAIPVCVDDGRPVIPKAIVEPRVFLDRRGDLYALNCIGDKAKRLKSDIKTVQAARAVCHDNRSILDAYLRDN